MYTFRQCTTRVSDRRRPYGPPMPGEDFPAAGVLDDLPVAPADDLPLILTRYAVLRAWMLIGAPGPLREHAADAARRHLQDLDEALPGRAELAAVLAAPPGAGLDRLEAAAEAATAAGHVAGARALREAAHRARWAAARFPPPFRS